MCCLNGPDAYSIKMGDNDKTLVYVGVPHTYSICGEV